MEFTVKKKRIDALDLVKGLAIFLVIWGHTLQHCLSSNQVDEPVYRFIYSFHMPLFMVLCGFFSWSSMKMNFWGMLKKKTLAILMPSIVWGGIIYLFVSAAHIAEGKSDALSISLLGNMVWTSYWFLKAVFLCYVIAWMGVNSKLWTPVWVLTSIFLIQLYPHFNIPLMYPCFLTGMYLNKVINKDKFSRYYYVYLLVFFYAIAFGQRNMPVTLMRI